MINKTTANINGAFKHGVVFTKDDTVKLTRYATLLQKLYLTATEHAEILMLRAHLQPLVENEYLK